MFIRTLVNRKLVISYLSFFFRFFFRSQGKLMHKHYVFEMKDCVVILNYICFESPTRTFCDCIEYKKCVL